MVSLSITGPGLPPKEKNIATVPVTNDGTWTYTWNTADFDQCRVFGSFSVYARWNSDEWEDSTASFIIKKPLSAGISR
jgi:hypothetical protein